MKNFIILLIIVLVLISSLSLFGQDKKGFSIAKIELYVIDGETGYPPKKVWGHIFVDYTNGYGLGTNGELDSDGRIVLYPESEISYIVNIGVSSQNFDYEEYFYDFSENSPIISKEFWIAIFKNRNGIYKVSARELYYYLKNNGFNSGAAKLRSRFPNKF